MAQLQADLIAALTQVSGDLDRVIADLQLGPRSRREPHRDQDAFVDRVEELAARLRGAVRGSRRAAPTPRPSAAPIWTNGAGQAAW